MNVVETVGVASCIAAADPGCSLAPEILRDSKLLQRLEFTHHLRLDWHNLLYPQPAPTLEQQVKDLCCRIASCSCRLVEKRAPFIFIGGDHSCAMGIWGGVMEGLATPNSLGLIWIDAHLDAHNFSTSPSGNIHGMPIAALLGQADSPLAKIYGGATLPPEQLVILGVRSYEAEEWDLMQRLQVKVHDMKAVEHQGGISKVLSMVVDEMVARGLSIGISIDLDAIDPIDAPGVGTPVDGGLSGIAVCDALMKLNGLSALLGLELTEFNPSKDRELRTEGLIAELISSVYGSSTEHRDS